MKLHLFSFLFIGILLAGCADNRIRKKPPVPFSPEELVTGCYYIVEDSTALKRMMQSEGRIETCFLDPKPITTVGDFESVEMVENEYGTSLNIRLNDKGSKAFGDATKKYTGKRLAFIIHNELVMAPVVQGEITGGAVQITGGFEPEKYKKLLKLIEFDMYEQ